MADTVWRDPDGRDRITEAHRPIWERIKAEHGVGDGTWSSIYDIPGFQESMANLVDQGWCVTDIGVFLGVSRERARQWLLELGLKAHHGTAPRIWSDEAERFVPITIDEADKMTQAAHVRATRLRIAARRRAVREEHVLYIQVYHGEHGCTPRLKDMSAFFGLSWPGICNYWRVKRKGRLTRTYAECYALMCRVAGVEPRERGGSGHWNAMEGANGEDESL